MREIVTTVDALEDRVGKLPAPADLKVIDHLDEGALSWIALAGALRTFRGEVLA